MTTSSTRDAEATKARLIASATVEFAAYGIAGARVDRIAAEAQSNKAQIYHYFDSKDGLFNAVFEEVVAAVLAEAPLDADDLPGYATRLFDGYERRPEIARLATWYRLERGADVAPIPAIVAANKAKVAAISAAQDAGRVSAAYSAEVLLGLVMHQAAFWVSQTLEYDVLTKSMSRRRRRQIVHDVVTALCTPAT